jgi:hypothetical protein
MVVAIYEKRCGYYAHSSDTNNYNEAPEAFLTSLMNSKTITLGDEMPKFIWATMGKLVPHLLGVLNFSYDLCFRCVVARWKGIFENYTLFHQTLTLSTV